MIAKSKSRKIIIISGLFLFFSFLGFFKSISAQSKSNSEPIITIERTACFGSCSVYSARIYNDGTVIYKGVDFVKIEGEKTYKIPLVRIEMLIKEFEKAGYFSFKDKYETDENGMSITDQPTTITSITLNGKQKKVVNYYGAPEKLAKLEDKIEDLADLLDYIGPI